MATYSLNRTTTEEKLVWYGMVLTYPFFAFGGLYVTGSLLGWLLFAMAILRWYAYGSDEQAFIPALIWLWIVAGVVLLITLIVAHINWDLGIAKTIKSSIGWAKGWALMPLFLLLGAIVSIKPYIMVRAACIVSGHSLIFALISVTLYFAGAPADLFTSPLQAVGGPGPDFFKVSLYGLNPETGVGRWRFFAPWAPAARFMACISLIFCAQEKNVFWRNIGIIGSLVMCLLSQSRAGWAIFLMLIPLLFCIDKLKNPISLIVFGVLICSFFLLGELIYDWINNAYMDVKAARPESSRVRSALASIALQRWENEAPIWGHGIVERGPKIVEFMPIGTHHSWYGLLFVKGAVGMLAIAIPLTLTSTYLLFQSHKTPICGSAFCMILVFICYSFFENLEILAFIYWPALLWIGMALNPMKTGEHHV